jgi:hypothetical protein
MDKNTEKKIDQVKTENLAAGGKFRMEDIPLRKFFDQAQYIEKTLLPAIEKKSGRGTDFIFFTEVYKSLLYAVLLADRDRTLVIKLQQEKQFKEYYKCHAEILETELLKYTTLEDLFIGDGHAKIADGIRRRVEDLLTNKG